METRRQPAGARSATLAESRRAAYARGLHHDQHHRWSCRKQTFFEDSHGEVRARGGLPHGQPAEPRGRAPLGAVRQGQRGGGGAAGHQLGPGGPRWRDDPGRIQARGSTPAAAAGAGAEPGDHQPRSRDGRAPPPPQQPQPRPAQPQPRQQPQPQQAAAELRCNCAFGGWEPMTSKREYVLAA